MQVPDHSLHDGDGGRTQSEHDTFDARSLLDHEWSGNGVSQMKTAHSTLAWSHVSIMAEDDGRFYMPWQWISKCYTD